MKALLNPKWLILIHHIPVMILMLLAYGNYEIIKSQLDPAVRGLWGQLGAVLLGISLLHLATTIILSRYKRGLPAVYGLISLTVYTLWLFWYYSNADTILPFSIPRWMVSDDMHLYVGSFLMPTLAHALFVMVHRWTSPDKPHKAWLNFLMAILVPALWYLFAQLIFPLWQGSSGRIVERLFMFGMVLSTLLFLFFLIRAIYIGIIKRKNIFDVHSLWWKIPITILLPLLGLALNNGLIDSRLGVRDGGGVFGNFTHPLFYILAIVNGALLCLPDWSNRSYRIPLFFGRSICFAYTFYFFMVFLPFLPLSLIFILFFGAGFLMLAPLALFVIHVDHLARDLTFLKQYFSKRVLYPLSALALLLIPIIIHTNVHQDRQNLQEALAYLYNPDYKEDYQINKKELSRTLQVLRQHKKANRSFFMEYKLPFLSAYYNWWVLDNLTLSNRKIDKIEAVFFDTPYFADPDNGSLRSSNDSLGITDIQVDSEYDESQQVWRTWVNLEISNQFQLGNQEFATEINLPEGCWISDYYLYVGDQKEMGQLAEKRAATWVYNQIRRVRRDPGILYYLNGRKVAFRVFPFAKGEVRRTGIQFLHKEPFELQLDNQLVQLGEADWQAQSAGLGKLESTIYLNSADLASLDTVYRRPYFHFVLDMSENTWSQKETYVQQIQQLEKNYPDLANQAKISLCNSYLEQIDQSEDWKQNILNFKTSGGFYLEHSIRAIAAQHYLLQEDRYPIIVVLTDDFSAAIIDNDLSDLAFAFPEGTTFFHYQEEQLQAHDLLVRPKWALSENPKPLFKPKAVLAWPNTSDAQFYISRQKKGALLVHPQFQDLATAELSRNSLESAMWQEAFWRSLQVHPNLYPKQWKTLLKASFQTGIMCSLSAYMVVETEAQRAVLKQKQEQVLKGNANLDLSEEEPRSMSEPGFFLVLGILVFLFWGRKLGYC